MVPSQQQLVDSQGGDSIDLGRIFELISLKRWKIILSVLLGIIIATVYILIAPRVYEGRAVVQVEARSREVLKIDQVASEDLTGLEVLKTIEAEFESKTLLLRVAADMGLNKTEGFGMKDGQPISDEKLAKLMSNIFKVKVKRGTRLIEITAHDRNPERAKALASLIVTDFLQQDFEQKAAVTRQANEFLLKESDRLKTKLQKSEQDLQQYKEQHDAVSLEDGQNIIVATLKDVTTRATEASAQRLKLESDLALVEELGDAPPEEYLKIQSINDLNPEISQIHQAMVSAQADLEVVKKRYLPKHPRYIASVQQLAALTESFKKAVAHSVAELRRIYDSARETEQRMDEARKTQEQAALDLNSLSIPFNVLQREVESDQALYDAVLSRLKETSVAESVDTSPIRLVEEPILQEKPVSPKKLFSLVFGVFAASGICIGTIILSDMVGGMFRTIEDAESSLGLRVLGVVPRVRISKGTGIVLQDHANSSAAEGFRALRAAIALIPGSSDRRSFLFTSSSPGDGKSFSSANFAAALAQHGLRTVILDADLRRPTLGTRFGIRGQGVSDYLKGAATVDEILHNSPFQNLFLVPGGSFTDAPSELLGNNRFPQLIKDLLRRFDRVVIDTPPVNVVSDALIIANLVDTVCLVLRADKTRRVAAKRSVQLLEMASAHISGIVWNQADRKMGGSSYYYYYYSGNRAEKEARPAA